MHLSDVTNSDSIRVMLRKCLIARRTGEEDKGDADDDDDTTQTIRTSRLFSALKLEDALFIDVTIAGYPHEDCKFWTTTDRCGRRKLFSLHL